MFEKMIVDVRGFARDLDDKQIKKLNIEQFRNLLAALTDKKLIDETEAAKSVQLLVEEVYDDLSGLLRSRDMDKVAFKAYKKLYAKLKLKVKEAFNLEPIGSIQSQYMAIGIAIGTSIGVAISAATNPGMMSIGIAVGVAIGAAIGRQKEKEAKEEGRLF